MDIKSGLFSFLSPKSDAKPATMFGASSAKTFGPPFNGVDQYMKASGGSSGKAEDTFPPTDTE